MGWVKREREKRKMTMKVKEMSGKGGIKKRSRMNQRWESERVMENKERNLGKSQLCCVTVMWSESSQLAHTLTPQKDDSWWKYLNLVGPTIKLTWNQMRPYLISLYNNQLIIMSSNKLHFSLLCRHTYNFLSPTDEIIVWRLRFFKMLFCSFYRQFLKAGETKHLLFYKLNSIYSCGYLVKVT